MLFSLPLFPPSDAQNTRINAGGKKTKLNKLIVFLILQHPIRWAHNFELTMIYYGVVSAGGCSAVNMHLLIAQVPERMLLSWKCVYKYAV